MALHLDGRTRQMVKGSCQMTWTRECEVSIANRGALILSLPASHSIRFRAGVALVDAESEPRDLQDVALEAPTPRASGWLRPDEHVAAAYIEVPQLGLDVVRAERAGGLVRARDVLRGDRSARSPQWRDGVQ